VMLATSTVGYSMYESSKKRLVIYRELIVLCGCLKRDFLYRATPILPLIDQTVERYKLTHLSFINSDVLKDGRNINSPLSSAVNKELNNFVHSLGMSDIQTQILLIDGFCDYITKEEEEQKINHSKNARLYLTFGVFSGLMAALIFV